MKLLPILILLGFAWRLAAQTTTTFVPLGSTWKYLDNGSNQGTAWRATGFDDSTWGQGPAELGYGDGDEATVVSFGPNSSSKYITTYFRKAFTVSNAAAYTTATVRVRRDDGVVVYLNGTEVFRSNMPAGTIGHTTLASSAASDEVTLFSGAVNAALLVEGTNVIAAEVHQNAASSSDLSFELDFKATIPGSTPTATPQSVSATEETPKAITLAGTDPQNDPLTFAIAAPPANGLLTGAPPNVTYTPNLNFAGGDSFTFTVSDGTNTSAAATVTITVANVNDLPVADALSQTLPEDGSVTFDVSGSDVESPYGMLPHYTQQLYNGNLSAITDGLSGATWNADSGTLFLIRNVSSGGGHSYEYTADGTHLRTITQTGFLDTEAIAWMYGTTFAIAEENNNQRISIVTIAPGATTLDRTAAGNVTYTTPVGNLQNLGIESLCYDAGRDLLYYLCEKPAGGAWPLYILNPQTGATTVLCDLNASVFTAGVATDFSDMAFDRATDTFVILSHESNKIVRLSRAGAVLEQRGFTTALTQAEMLALTPDRLRLFVGGEPKQFTRLALPSATLTYQIVTPPAHGALSGLPPRLTYTPVPNFSGTDSFTFRVHDGTVNSADATVTLNVTPANDPPSGGNMGISAEATEPTLIVLPVSDPDGDELTIQTTAPAHGTLTVEGTTVTYTAEVYNGADGFTYTVSDGEFTAGPFTVSITVLNFNIAPVAEDQSLTLNEDTPQPLTLTASDAENDPLTWSLLTPPAHGTLTGAAPDFTYTPSANYHGADSFTFRVFDGQENSNTATVSLTVAPVNDAPVASAGSGNIEASYPLPLTLAGSDVDGDAITFAIVDQPAHGALTGIAPSVTYTADIAWAGPDTFTFTVSDGTLTSAPAIVTINVAPYNMPPVANNGSVTTDEDTAAAVTLAAGDPESQPLTYHIVTPPAQGTLSGTAPNLIYTPALNFNGADSFTWTASDATKTSAPATFNLTVSPVNDAPVALALSAATETDTPAPVPLSGSDAENDLLTFTVVTPPASGILSGTPPALTYTPNAGFTGADSFTYAANDGALDSAPATVSVTVTPPVLDNLVSSGAAWKYLANGSNQGTAWRAPAFDDTAWPQGPAQLGYGEGDEATVVPYGPDANNRYLTTYFRREFEVPNPGVLTGPLKLDVLRDDGAVVYLNGTEVFRTNMPAGTIAWNTLAPAAVGGADESTFYSTTFSAGLIVPGRNVLAVEIHQSAANSSDVSFDLRLAETSPSITRGPYVQMTGPDRATVRWRTNVAVGSVLNYGTVAGTLTSSVTSGTLQTEHEIHVTGLTPDTRYYYSAGSALATFASGPAYYFTTHPPADTVRPYRFWVIGDMGTATANQTTVRDAFSTWNGAQQVDGVLTLGDNVYDNGTDAEFQTKFFDIYPAQLRNTTFWMCFGNHDAGAASSATQSGPYYDSFTLPKLGEAGGVASGTEAYYSFDYGNIHFVCLDSEGTNRTAGGAMAQWLQADLAANWREWTVAFWHHPPYSKGGHDSDNAAADGGRMKDMREVFVPILESYGVDLLLFGHEHAYFRSKFVDGHYGASSTFNETTMLKQAGMGDPAGDGPYVKADGAHNGAVYTVAGSSGRLDSYARSMPVLAVNLNELGSVVLDVHGRELTSRFLNNTGTVRDTFRIVHNSTPAAHAATLAGAEDTALDVTLTATDADHDPLTWEIVTPPAAGSLTGTAPNLTFIPPADFHGEVTLQFRVNDGRSHSAIATVTLDIAPVNDAPLAAAGSLTTSEDAAAAMPLAGSDADGDALSFTITTPPAHGSLSGSAPDLTYTPDVNWHGSDSFAFTTSDGTAVSAPALVTITVTPVNDAPLAGSQSLDGTEDSALPVLLTGGDADGDALSFTITLPPANGTLSGDAPDLIYTPGANFHGSDAFAFTVSDGTATSAPAGIAITVAPVNDAPVAPAQSLTGDEDSAAPVTLTAADADGDALTYSVTVPPAHGSLSGTPPNLTYTPGADWHGADSFQFTASDGSAVSAPALISLIIAAVNDPPSATPLAAVTSEDTPVSIAPAGADVDGDPLTVIILTLPEHGLLSGTLPHLTYTPDADWHGADSFTFAVTDGPAVSAAETATITVTAVNDRPVAGPQSLHGAEDSPHPVTLAATEADGDALTFTITLPPAHGTLSGTAPDLIYTPAADWHGLDSFSFTASDATETSLPAAVTIEITPVNDAPRAGVQTLSTDEDTPLPVTLTGTDADGEVLTFAITAPPAQGTLSGAVPHLLYTPAAHWSGTDSFAFTVSDGTLVSEAATVSITVHAVNSAPLADAAAYSTGAAIPVSFTLTGSDAEGGELTWNLTAPPAYGTLTGTAPALTYTPNLGFTGTDQLTFTVSDGSAASAPAVVTFAVGSNGPWQLVARTGSVAPGTGGAVFQALQTDFVSDAAGRASFRGTAGSLTGIWTAGPAGLEPAVLQGAAAPGAAGAVFDAVTTGPWAAGDGEVLVLGKLLPGTGGVTTATDLGYWLRSGGAAALVAREGSAPPSLPAAARFNVLAAVATLEAGGNYAFAASMVTNSSLGITSASDTGLWGTFGAPPRLLVRENSAAPGSADGGLFDTLTAVTLTSNGAGQFGFAGSMKVAGSITTANRYGLWLGEPAQLELVARGGSQAPGAPEGAIFAQPLNPAAGGALVFRATLAAAGGGVTTGNDTGLWALDAGVAALLAREGSPAPGVAAGGVFSGLTEGANVNGAGELAFRASLASGGGVTSATNAGVWARSRYTGGVLTLIARKGTAAPGAGTATFAGFDYPHLSADGREVFTATLTQSTATGVTAANDRGLWVRTYGSLALVLREGQNFTLAPGDVRTVSAITLPAARSGGRTPLSEEGRLLVLLSFTDGATALYHYSMPVNVAPVAGAQAVTTAEDTAAAITLAGTDADGDALNFAITVPPQQGTLSGAAPHLTYTPSLNWSGTDSFTFTVSDGKDAPVSAAVQITVTPVNDAPVASAAVLATSEDTAAALSLGGSDVEGDALAFSIVTPPAHGVLTGAAPALTYTPAPNYFGPDSFTYLVSDGQSDGAPAAISINVSSVNDVPFAAAQTLSGAEDHPLAVTLTGTDEDGDVLAFTVTTPPAHGTLSGTAPELTYTADADWNGTDSFAFTVSDGLVTSAPATVTLNVQPVNDIPVVYPQTIRTEENLAVVIDLTGSDTEGSALSFSIVTPPAHGSLSGTAPHLTYTPQAGWLGTDGFTYTAGDGTGVSVPAAVTVHVRPANEAPVAAAQSVSTDEDTARPVLLTATDAEGDALTFTITQQPAHGTLSGTLPHVSYTPAAHWSGADSFSFAAFDGEEFSAPAAVSITVTPVNDVPTATPVTVSAEVGVPVAVLLTGSDVEGSALAWTITVPPAYGTLSGTGAAQTYTPNLAWRGVDQFTFTVTDGEALSPPVPATITVASSGPWQLVARIGNEAPGTAGATFSALPADFVSDAAGRASFRGTAGSVTGIWTEGAAGLEPAILQGAAAHGVAGTVFDAVTARPWAAGDGELLLYGRLLAGTGGVTTSNDLGYWLRRGGATALIARENDPVPSLPAAARFNALAAVATLQPGGNYIFAASLRTNSALGITSANDTGLWGTFGAPPRLLVRENDAAPGSADGGVFDTLTTAGLTSNGAGQFGFTGAMKIAGAITTANASGLWLWDPAQFGLVARGGSAAPGTPGVFAQPLHPSLGGSFAFRATLSTASGGVTTGNDTGLWALDAGAVHLLAREGAPAPGVAAGGNFSGLTEGAAMNDSGELAFRATLATGGGVTSANNAGMWVRSRYTGGTLALAARKGAIAAGAGTGTFASFDYPFLAADGREAFTATLTQNTGTGVTAASDRGLWVRSTAGTLTLSLREGSAFTLAAGDVRTVSTLTLPAAPSSGRTPFSEDGRLLVLIGFTDGTSALYQFTLP